MSLFGGGKSRGEQAHDDPVGTDTPLTYPEIAKIQEGAKRALEDAAKRERIERERASRRGDGNTGSNNDSGGV